MDYRLRGNDEHVPLTAAYSPFMSFLRRQESIV
jgi:hypothetical protein